MSEPAEQGDVEKPARQRGGFTSTYVLVPLVVIAVILLVLELIPRDEYMLLPGDAVPVASMISIQGHPLRHTSGQFYLTDVSIYKVNHLLEELYSRFNSDTDLQPAQQFAGGLSESQYLKLNVQLMSDSTHQAEAAALGTLKHYHPRFARTGPKIVFVMPKMPAQGRLRVGDVIEFINGHRIHRAGDVSPLVSRLRPGTTVRIGILRGRSLKQIVVGTKASTEGTGASKHTVALMGIYVQDQIEFPVKVAINAGSIGGPSAGLMFSLGIVQRLSPGDLTRGCKIAGTGTIDAAGNVGEIGGAKQKVIAARHAGAQYFFVPTAKDNLEPALAHRGSVTVVPVKTLGEALSFLKRMKPCSP